MALDAIPAPSPPLIEPVVDAVPMVTSVDCATGVVTVRPMTKDEQADKAALETQYLIEKQAAADAAIQRDADLATLAKAADSDPTTAALLRVLGLS